MKMLIKIKALIGYILCGLGFHTWVICRMVDSNGRLTNYHRDCEYCNKQQKLKRPEKYHPTKYIWVDIDMPIKNNDQLD